MNSTDPNYFVGHSPLVMKQGSIAAADTEVIVIPVSIAGTISSEFEAVLKSLGENPPAIYGSNLGDIKYISSTQRNRKNLKGIIYATSVGDQNSTYPVIRTIGSGLADFAFKNDIRSIAVPVLGTGSGGLDKEAAFQILVSAFTESGMRSLTCKLEVFIYESETWDLLSRLPLPSASSLQLVVLEIVKQSVKSKWIQEIAQSETFYFEIAQQKFQEYLGFTPQKEPDSSFYTQLIAILKAQRSSFGELLNHKHLDEEGKALLLIIGKLIAHIDSKGFNKNIWNEYPDKRTMARASVRQNIWVEHLLRYKMNGSLDQLPPNIRNAIRYLQDPEGELTMLSENHRWMMMKRIFNKTYTGSDSLQVVFDFFDKYVTVYNFLNKGALYSRILYLNDIKMLWQEGGSSEEVEADIEDRPEKNTDEPVIESIIRRIKPVIHSDIFAEHDLLNYKIYAHAIVEFLKHKDTRPPLTIGILAPWGKGKTTMMRFVQQKLDVYRTAAAEAVNECGNGSVTINEDVVATAKTRYKDLKAWLKGQFTLDDKKLKNPTVWFNAWKFQKSEQIWAGFAYEIIHQLVDKLPAEKDKEQFWLTLNLKRVDKRKIKDQITFSFLNKIIEKSWIALVGILVLFIAYFLAGPVPYIKGIIPYIPVPWMVWAIGYYHADFKNQKINFDLSKYVKQPDYEEKRGYFHQVESDLKYVLEILVSKKDPVVIFIDDLDRCSPKIVADVVEAINLFISGDFPDCYFVLGQDAQMVAASLDAAYKDMEAKVTNIQRGHGSLGWFFMEKFIQLQFNIPNITSDQSHDFLKALFDQAPDLSAKNDTGQKKSTQEKYQELFKNINAAANSENFVSFNADINALESDLLKTDPEKVTLLKEQMITKAAQSFTDDDTDVENMMETYSKYLGNSPRLIKRFVNLYRFYRFMQFTGQCKKLTEIDSNVLGRWIIFAIRWPQLVRCIQWDTEKDFLSGSAPADRAAAFEQELLECDNFPTWKQYVKDKYADSIPWLYDANLFDFMQQTKGEECSLKEAIQVGFW